MEIKYYKDSNITYTSRKRYKELNKTPFSTEKQYSVLLGDGANTSIKTSKENICDYVTIDDTRWFVTSYTYENGGQVTLNLQRDVIGEFGLEECYGKIDRGYTTSVLRQRKELTLNQILKRRDKLFPSSNKFGNYTVTQNNGVHNDLWGILYLTKPTEGEDDIVINIPELSITDVVDYEPLNNDTVTNVSNNYQSSISFFVKIEHFNEIYLCELNFFRNEFQEISYTKNISEYSFDSGIPNYLSVLLTGASSLTSENVRNSILESYVDRVAENVINNNEESPIYKFFDIPSFIPKNEKISYDNIIIKEDNKYFLYEENEYKYVYSGRITLSQIHNLLVSNFRFNNFTINSNIYKTNENVNGLSARNNNIISGKKITKEEISSGQAGDISLNVTSNIVDEPYKIFVIPLFDCTITDFLSTYTINRRNAFSVFNKMIQYLSGTSGYLVDAQVYPYCPVLTEVVTEFGGIPIFNIMSNSYSLACNVQLEPYNNIKKEYISKQYSIISPEQSDKFVFNFYDYYDFSNSDLEEQEGTNNAILNIEIKTALKPYSIISSAVIQPQENSIIGKTYSSDLRGCKPSSNGFEVSLSTDQFQQYVRNNSNYQNIFNKNQEYLGIQQKVEKTNEIVSAITNTISASASGAIGGGAVGNTLGGTSVGAAIGGAVSGIATGVGMTIQAVQNEKLRKYEYNLQQEMFDLEIGTIKNLPNIINRISSFNEIILKDFWFIIEVYECSPFELEMVDRFIKNYSYSIGVFDFFNNYIKEGRFIRGNIITSGFITNLHNIAVTELKGGIYYYGS